MLCAVDQSVCEALYPAGYVSNIPDDPQVIVCRGGACIVSPFRDLLAGPLWDREGILTAEVDLREIPRAQYDFDPVGHSTTASPMSLRCL
jgi:nitrilase